MKKLEVACFNLESAKIAAQAGADRIKFCADYASGGTTPSKEDFIRLRAFYAGPIYVMIRPRGGDFVYTQNEIENMKADIEAFVHVGADGFVFGALTNTNQLDVAANGVLIDATIGLPCTFHRAFDLCTNIPEALSQVEKLGFTSILSSGGMKTALEGLENLRLTQKNTRLQIIAGGGIRSNNIATLAHEFATEFYHSSGILTGALADAAEITALKSALAIC